MPPFSSRVIYNTSGDRKSKTGLARLSALFLGETIQDWDKSKKERKPHDPKEDAVAAM